MSTFREIVYMVLDLLKLISDDSYYTEDHILYLVNKYRSFYLKQKYIDVKKQIPENNYQTIRVDTQTLNSTGGSKWFRSILTIPYILQIGNPKVYKDVTAGYYASDIAFVPRERMKYTGLNKYLNKIIYCSVDTDNILTFKTFDTTISNLGTIKFTAVFLNALEASLLLPSVMPNPIDNEFPLEEALIPVVIESVVKELSGAIYRPTDDTNNGTDDLSNVKITK